MTAPTIAPITCALSIECQLAAVPELGNTMRDMAVVALWAVCSIVNMSTSVVTAQVRVGIIDVNGEFEVTEKLS